MSILSSIAKVVGGVASFIPGVGGIVGKAIGAIGAAASPAQKLITKTAAKLPVLPGVGSKLPALIKSGAKTVGAAVGANYLFDQNGTPVMRRRRRRKGITPKDLSSFKRVSRLIDKFAAPVHRLRKNSYKPQSH